MQSAISSEFLLKIIEELMAELHPDAAHRQAIALDSSLDADLGLDSLARMELLARLEKKCEIRL